MSNDIREMLRPYTRRIHFRVWLRRFGIFTWVGAAAGVAVLLLAFLIPIANAPGVAAGVAVATWVVSGVVLAFMRLQPEQLAAEIDRCGFQERVQTMLALQGDPGAPDGSLSPFVQLQREDTFRALQAADPRGCLPIRLPRRDLLIAGAGILAAALLALLPTPHDSLLQERADISRVMQQQAERIEAAIDLLNKDENLSDELKKELNDKLKELAKELRQGTDYKESMKQISELQDDLRSIEQRQGQQGLNDLRQAFENHESTKGLADKLEGKSAQQAADEIRNAIEEAQNEGEEATEEMIDALREAAENTEDEALAQALSDLADALEAGDEDGIQQAMDALEQALGDAEGQTGDSTAQIGDDLRLAKSQMSQLSQYSEFTGDPSQLTPDGQDQGDQGDSGDSGDSGDGQDDGDQGDDGDGSDGDNNGQGGDQGQGQDAGGQGQGQGQGAAGQDGQGSGGRGDSRSGDPGGSGAGGGTGDLVESEKIYDDSRMAADGSQTRIRGEIDGDGPRQQADTDAGDGTVDGYIPYQEVVGEYAEDAVNAARREQLPPAVREWVEGYFNALQN